jgi:hypothetical protein
MVWQELGPTPGVSEANMTQDEIRYQRVMRELPTDPVGLAEDHLKPEARLLTIRLVENGYVHRLFLECNSNLQPNFNAVVNSPPGAARDAAIVTFVSNAGPAYGNSIVLGEVARVAVNRGIPVHLIDLDIARKTRWDSVVARDAHAAAQFTAITAPTGRWGCVVLFGGHHLHEKDPTIFRGGAQSLGERLNLGYVKFPQTLMPGGAMRQ